MSDQPIEHTTEIKNARFDNACHFRVVCSCGWVWRANPSTDAQCLDTLYYSKYVAQWHKEHPEEE